MEVGVGSSPEPGPRFGQQEHFDSIQTRICFRKHFSVLNQRFCDLCELKTFRDFVKMKRY